MPKSVEKSCRQLGAARDNVDTAALVDWPLQPRGVRLQVNRRGLPMRSICSGIFSALLVIGLAAGSWAQNGLERFDTAAKVLDVKTLQVNLRGETKITLSLVMDGISDKSGMAGAKDDGRLRNASLTLDDSGLLAKLLPAMAKEQGAKPEEIVQTALM